MRNRRVYALLVITLVIMCLITTSIVHAETTDVATSIIKSLQEIFEKTSNTIVYSMNTTLQMIANVLVKVSEVLSIALTIIGLFLWFSRISPYTGRRLLISAVLLFVFAYVLKHVHI
ncbi:MAG: hypothetical protein GXO26_05880 [Crenarchaeota archaeon]|nr:hypothetical protein [Thermoproteota archaeon]